MGIQGIPQMGSPSAMQVQELEKQLSQQIDQYVASLPPEDQLEFQQLVEEEARKIEAMAPDELNKYIQQTIEDVEKAATSPASETKKPAVKPEVKKPTIKPEAKKIPTEKQDRALFIINGLISSIESYILKMNAIPELPPKLPKWARQGRIAYWKQGATFESFKKELEAFNQQMYKIKRQDAKTKKYTFLADIIANETIMNNLAKVNSSLSNWEPKIKFRALEFESLGNDTKKAIIQSTNALLEGMHALALPKALDDVIVKYDPEAKKLRDEAERLQKKAFDQSKRKPSPTAAKVSGYDPTGKVRPRSPQQRSYGRGYSSRPSYGSGSRPSYGGGYRPSYSSTRQEYGQRPSTAPSGGAGSFAVGKKSKSSAADQSFMKDKDQKGLSIDASKTSSDKDKSTVQEPQLTVQDEIRIGRFVAAIEEDVINKLKSVGLHTPHDTLSIKDFDVKAPEVSTAKTAMKSLNGALQSLHKMASEPSPQKNKLYASKIQQQLQSAQKAFKTIIRQSKNLDKNRATLSDTVKYAYFDDSASGDKVDQEKKKAIDDMGGPLDLNELAWLLGEVGTSVGKLQAGQALPSKRKTYKSVKEAKEKAKKSASAQTQ